jgi:uncharacterized protein YcbK (DUF882 family)
VISWQKILGSYKETDIPKEHLDNLKVLHKKINEIRKQYAKPMTPTSIYRSMADHLRIYKDKGITDISLIPMKSKHLSGEAIDIADPKGSLMTWTKANVKVLEDVGLWCEDGIFGWCHFQIVPPKSGKRFFLP